MKRFSTCKTRAFAALLLCLLGLSSSAFAQGPAAPVPVLAVNSGGGAAGRFGPDGFLGAIESGDNKGVPVASTAPVSVAGVQNAAPVAVYQTERRGDPALTYVLTGTAPGGATPELTPFIVRLHFAETRYTQPGQRRFNIAIQGDVVATDFDIVAEAGGPRKALVRDFVAKATGRQRGIQVTLEPGAAGVPTISGIEIIPTTLFVLQQPTLPNFTENRSYELGTRFTAAVDGEIRAIRYWKATSETGAHVGRIWDAQGRQLAQATFVEPSSLPFDATPWREAALATPLRIRAGQTYTVSVNCNAHYVATVGALNPAVTSGYLSTQGTGSAYGNIGTFPTSTYQFINYFRDVVFVPSPPAAAGPLLAVNAGGSAQGPFSADNSFVGFNGNQPGRPIATTAAVSTAGVSGAAPAAVYQTQRVGERFAYRLGGFNPDSTPRLRAGTRYLVRLHFAEIRFTQPGQRQFDVAVGSGAVAVPVPGLSNFDIVAAAGGPNKAVVREFVTVAQPASDGSNNIQIQFAMRAGAAPSNVPAIAGVEILPATNVPLTAINAGGSPVAPYWTGDVSGAVTTTTAAISTAGVRNPAPPVVYQTGRVGQVDVDGKSRIQYLLAGFLDPGVPTYTIDSTYLVRLHFAEIGSSLVGQRQFNVLVNDVPVLANLDIAAEAGGPNKALVKEFIATARSFRGIGSISLAFEQGAAGIPLVNGIEVLPARATAVPRLAQRTGGALAASRRSSEPLQVAVYPNPAADRLTVQADASLEGAALRLADAQGRVLRQLPLTGPTHAAELDVRGLPDGLYYLLVPGAPAQKVVVRR